MNLEVLQDRDERSRRLRSQSPHWFALAGWVLIGGTLNTILFASLPLRLLEPEWQLRLVAAILGGSSFFLLGLLLVCGAWLLSPESNTLRGRAAFLRMLAGWFAVILILIVPFQLYAGIRAFRKVESRENQGLQQMRKTLQGLKATASEEEMRGFVARLPNPPQLPAKFDVPFEVVKQRAVTNLSSAINTATNRLDVQRRSRWESFAAEATRNTVQAVLMALAFTGIGQGRSGKAPLLQGLFGRIGLLSSRRG